MHLLTQAKDYELRVDMEDFEGNSAFAQYGLFSVGPEAEGYKLKLGSFTKGTAGGTTFHTQIKTLRLWISISFVIKSINLCCFSIRGFFKPS